MRIKAKGYMNTDYRNRISMDCTRNRTPPIVTDDGCRLDGSHRLSILAHLEIKKVDLNVARYEDIFKEKKIQKIREQVIAYRKETYGLSTWTDESLKE